MKQDKD